MWQLTRCGATADGNWARVAASHARYGACETAQWTKAHLMPWTGRAQRYY